MKTKKRSEKRKSLGIMLLLASVLIISSLVFIIAVDPVNPDGTTTVTTTEKTNSALQNVTVGGGKIATFNLTANVQDPRWKAFVGNVQGSFTLDDAAGSTIYDWALASVTGRIYTSRYDTITWAGIGCADTSQMEAENAYLEHTGASDNITATFRDNTHSGFPVGAETIGANTCPTLNTYRSGDNSQGAGADFEEMVLADTSNELVYATILEEDALGFDGNLYDFQMIVPENGSSSFTGATPYYLYVEISS